MNANRLNDFAATLLRVALGVLYLAHVAQKVFVFTLPGTAQPSTLGQLQLAGFPNPQGMDPKGGNIYAENAASGAPVALAASRSFGARRVKSSRPRSVRVAGMWP